MPRPSPSARRGRRGHDPRSARRPGPARLLALRLHGFKSFAERTVVEFGAGISAIVGPNGSGKSNLADALRWALGEQGRALRSRKAEDVIWAGSERRAAQGMADVTILLDNADGLLPVDYQVLELGRRLYRSGENDYLLNRQRVRLRDLVDLLDGAHLADNAFLFIGQGMVDQALALRPEERRPLFEEVAGVRRHERRRRKAEEQLAESEANLARVEDIVAELRPQARRLAAQAEQQATRVGAGDELAAALLLAAHARWFDASARAGAAADRRAMAQAEADTAMQELQTAEEAASGLAQELGARAVVETERRATLDAAQAAVNALRLREERAAADLEGIMRDRTRLHDERAVAEASLVVQRRALSQPIPARDVDLDGELSEAERALSDALAELASLERSAGRGARISRPFGEQKRSARPSSRPRGVGWPTSNVARPRRRSRSTRPASTGPRSKRRWRLRRWHWPKQRKPNGGHRLLARGAGSSRRGRRNEPRGHGTERGRRSALATLRGRLDALLARQADEEARGIAKAARRVGGRRLDEDLVVDPALRAAVEAALGEAARGYLVDAAAVPGLAAERGVVVTDRTDEAGARRRLARLPTRRSASEWWSVAAASSPRRCAVTATARPPAAWPGRLAAGPRCLSCDPARPAAGLGGRAA